MKKFLIFLLTLGVLSLGEQFPPGSVDTVGISWLEGAACIIQNKVDSLIYIVSVKQGAAGENAILILNNNLEIVKKIDSVTAGFALEYVCCADYDPAGKMWFGANNRTIYCLEQDTLKKTFFTNGEFGKIGSIKCFADKLYLATNSGLYSYDPVSCALAEEVEKGEKIEDIAIDSNTVYATGERIVRIEYFIARKGIDWVVQSSNDSLLKPFFAYDVGGMTEHKTTYFIESFRGSIFVGGIQNLLIKYIGNGQWEDCTKDFPENIYFSRNPAFDSLGNVWVSNSQGIFKYNIEEKNLTKYEYMENNLPQSGGQLAVSSHDGKKIFYATKKMVLRHNSDQTVIIDNNKKFKIAIGLPSFSPEAVYNLRGQVVYTFAPNQNQKIKLPTGMYILRSGTKSKMVFIKKGL